MKTGRLKRSLSLFLTLAMAVSLCAVPVSASESPSMKSMAKELITDSAGTVELTKANIADVTEDLIAMETHAIDPELVSISEIDAEGNIVYAYQILEDYISYVDVTQEEDGSTTFHYVEGDREDYLRYAPDGTMYLNDCLVTITYSEGTEDSSPVLRAGGFQHVYQTACPGGTSPGQYTGKRTLFMNSTIELIEKTIVGSTIGAIAGIIITVFSGGNIVIGNTVANALAGALINFATSGSYIKATSASFTDYRRPLSPQDSLMPKFRHEVVVTIAGKKQAPTYYYEVWEPR